MKFPYEIVFGQSIISLNFSQEIIFYVSVHYSTAFKKKKVGKTIT